jgi:ribulose-5-phosphate 4-epimerase/fuculose-1-phosphate aldolase
VAELSNALAADLDELARACRVLELEGHGDRVVGHMALRDPDGRGLWMKRAGIALGEVVDRRDFVLLDFDGRLLAGDGRPHGEWPIHAELLRLRADINATAHTHPFYASIYSAAEEPLATIVPRATTQPLRTPRFEDSSGLVGTPQMARDMVAVMGAHHAVLLRNHGLVTCGPTIRDPVLIAIAVEKMCQESLIINGSNLRFRTPDESELLHKLEEGTQLDPAIVGGQVLYDYYCRKLARAEAAGNPLFATERVPLRTH